MTRVTTVQLMGGLGNQLFQLGFGLAIPQADEREIQFSFNELKLNGRRVPRRDFDVKDLLDESEITYYGLARILLYGLSSRVSSQYVVRERRFGESLLNEVTSKTRFVMGYFQTHELMRAVWPQFVARIRKAGGKWSQILEPAKDYCALHVRLGDIAQFGQARDFHGLTHPEYFERALDEVCKRQLVSTVKVVSDEPQAAKLLLNELGLERRFELIFSDGKSSVDDLATMAQASAVVASNSTFSWWGGFMSEQLHGALVVVPVPWFASNEVNTRALIPDHWISVKRQVL